MIPKKLILKRVLKTVLPCSVVSSMVIGLPTLVKADPFSFEAADLLAQEAPNPTPTPGSPEFDLPQVDVFGDRLDPPQVRFEAPNQQILLDREEVDRFQFPLVGDVLRQQPSVTFGGPFDENRDIRLRGFNNGFTQVLIDGQRLPTSRNDRQVPVNSIPTTLVEDIEIIRTPTAAQDSQGIAGTVNLVLRSPQERVGQLNLGISTLETLGPFGNFEILYGDRLENVSFLFTGGIQSRGSFKFKDRQTTTAAGILTDSDIEDDAKEFVDYSVAPRLEWRISERDTLHLEGLLLGTEEYRDVERTITQFSFQDNGDLERIRERVRLNDENTRLVNWRLGSRWERQLAENSQLEISLLAQGLDNQVSKDEQETTTNTNFDEDPAGVAEDPQISNTVQQDSTTELDIITSAQLDWQPNEAHQVSAGINGSFRDRDANRIQNDEPVPNDIFGIEETQLNLFLQDEWSWNLKHSLLVGARLELVETTATGGDGISQSQSDSQFNPSLSYRYQAGPNTVWRLGVARTVARPSFGDLVPFVNERRGNLGQPDQVGNPDLRPQTAWGVDLGLEQKIVNGEGLIGVNFYFRDIQDLVESQITQDPVTERFIQRPVNIGSAQAYGVELDGQAPLTSLGLPQLTLIGNLSFLSSEVKDSTTGETRPFNEQPDYLFNAGFDYTLADNSFSLGLNYRYVPEIQFTEQTGTIRQQRGIEASGTLDGYITWRPDPDLTLTLYGRNLTGIESVRPREVFEDGILQSIQTDFQAAERSVGLNLAWEF